MQAHNRAERVFWSSKVKEACLAKTRLTGRRNKYAYKTYHVVKQKEMDAGHVLVSAGQLTLSVM